MSWHGSRGWRILDVDGGGTERHMCIIPEQLWLFRILNDIFDFFIFLKNDSAQLYSDSNCNLQTSPHILLPILVLFPGKILWILRI